MSAVLCDLPEKITADEARLELAVALYREGRITQGQAATLSGFSRRAFMEILGMRGVPFSNITAEDFGEKMAAWPSLPPRTVRP